MVGPRSRTIQQRRPHPSRLFFFRTPRHGMDRPGNHPAPRRLRTSRSPESNRAVIIQTSDPNEYYLLENRQLTGWDAYLPNAGMLIWHVDYDRAVFNVHKNTATSPSTTSSLSSAASPQPCFPASTVPPPRGRPPCASAIHQKKQPEPPTPSLSKPLTANSSPVGLSVRKCPDTEWESAVTGKTIPSGTAPT